MQTLILLWVYCLCGRKPAMHSCGLGTLGGRDGATTGASASEPALAAPQRDMPGRSRPRALWALGFWGLWGLWGSSARGPPNAPGGFQGRLALPTPAQAAAGAAASRASSEAPRGSVSESVFCSQADSEVLA